MVVVLGVDPGWRHMGVAVVEVAPTCAPSHSITVIFGRTLTLGCKRAASTCQLYRAIKASLLPALAPFGDSFECMTVEGGGAGGACLKRLVDVLQCVLLEAYGDHSVDRKSPPLTVLAPATNRRMWALGNLGSHRRNKAETLSRWKEITARAERRGEGEGCSAAAMDDHVAEATMLGVSGYLRAALKQSIVSSAAQLQTSTVVLSHPSVLHPPMTSLPYTRPEPVDSGNPLEPAVLAFVKDYASGTTPYSPQPQCPACGLHFSAVQEKMWPSDRPHNVKTKRDGSAQYQGCLRPEQGGCGEYLGGIGELVGKRHFAPPKWLARHEKHAALGAADAVGSKRPLARAGESYSEHRDEGVAKHRKFAGEFDPTYAPYEERATTSASTSNIKSPRDVVLQRLSAVLSDAQTILAGEQAAEVQRHVLALHVAVQRLQQQFAQQ